MNLPAAITNSPPQQEDLLAGLRDNIPPVEVPWPAWMWWAIAASTLLLAALLIWLGIQIARRKSKTHPPTARQIALQAIEKLRAQASSAEPYHFSIAVSDVLRTFVSDHYNLRATQQTSPEFLASLRMSDRFSDTDHKHLATFLERCDLLKFARIEARSEENSELLREAAAFVQGGTL